MWKLLIIQDYEQQFQGRIINSMKRGLHTNIGGLVGQLTGITALVDKSKLQLPSRQMRIGTNQTVGGLAGSCRERCAYQQ